MRTVTRDVPEFAIGDRQELGRPDLASSTYLSLAVIMSLAERGLSIMHV